MDRTTGREAQRVAAVRRLDIFDAPNEPSFDHIAELARLALDMPMAALSIMDADRQRFFAASGFAATDAARDASICDTVVTTGDVLVVEDASSDPRFRTNPRVTGEPGIRGYIGAPLVLNGHVLGAVCAADTRPRVFDATARMLIVHLADCTVREMALHLRASLDDLTGFLTRNAFLSRLRTLQEDHAREGRKAVLAFLDLDHFKALNDRFGHAAGDRVLQVVAATCQEHLGDEAYFGRIGGEEFGIALPDHGLDQAVKKLERLRVRIFSLAFGDEPSLRITGSFGVSALHRGIANVSVWCKMADAALYGAKHAGRNTIIVFRDALGLPTGEPLPVFPRMREGAKPPTPVHGETRPTDIPVRPS